MIGDITNVSRLAKAHAKLDKEVIDATMGVFFDDEGIIGYSKVFEKIRCEVSPNERFNYGAVSGGAEFEENVMKWVFGNQRPTLSHRVLATMGATGAISNVFDLYKEPKYFVLVSDLYWHNYQLIAQAYEMDLKQYQMFKDNQLFFDDLKIKALELSQKQNRLIIILNYPAHNPTGYSLKEAEMNAFINLINELSILIPIVLIFDIAYLDLDRHLNHLQLLNKIEEKVTIILTYSFSKSLGLYGLRLGAAIVLTTKSEENNQIFSNLYFLARTKWSSPNQEAIATFNKIMSSDTLTEKVINEITEIKNALQRRSKLFLSKLTNAHIITYPYHQGFFITIPYDDSLDLCERLKLRKVYVVPLNKGIRVAIASLSTEKILLLAEHLIAELT